MQTVTVSRTMATSPEALREAMADWAAFTRAAGFDEVSVSGETIRVENRVGLAKLELEMRVVESEAAFAYEQVEGIFEEMRTEFTLTPVEDGTEVTATTAFALDLGPLGDFLDATIIKRQRTAEIERQLDYLEGQSTT